MLVVITFVLNILILRSLCDINQHGKLDMEQFSLAMWLVEHKLKGIDPPTSLTPEMTPPSSRAVPSTVVQVKIFNYYFIVKNDSACINIKIELRLYP